MDKAKILRLLDEADDIVSALYRQGANKDYKCKSIREKLKAIAAEITAPPKSNADRIRQMTDEELGFWKARPACESCAWFENRECDNDCIKYNCFNGAIEWLRKEVSEDAGSKTD